MELGLKRDIEYSRLLGEFIGTLEGILFWDIDPDLSTMLKKKVEELNEKAKLIEDDGRRDKQEN